jgi:TolA-binding protein
MKNIKFVSFVIVLSLILFACNSGKKKKMDKIQFSEKELFSDTVKIINKEKIAELVKKYEDFAKKYSEDTIVPVYLFKAANLSMNFFKPDKAIKLFDKILNDYPDYKKCPEVLFLKAFVYENNLKDLAKANKTYNEFLSKYPKHVLAESARISISNLGKSPEQIIKEIEEKIKLDTINAEPTASNKRMN